MLLTHRPNSARVSAIDPVAVAQNGATHNLLFDVLEELDVDVFGRQWTELGPKKPKFTIMISRDDRALAISRLISGDVDRVGQIDPSREPYKSKLQAAE